MLRDQNGRLVILDRKLGAGGEATVSSVLGRPGVVAKVYHRPNLERGAKLKSMLANPPSDPTFAQGHISICWPAGLLFRGRQGCAGFLMPRIDFTSSAPIFRLYNPRDRQHVAPGFTWKYLLRTALNIASAVEAIHARDYVIGDLNESNILVTNTALATLVDCDSMQVPRPGTGSYFHCVVGKPEFTAPELQGCELSQVDRAACHDNFSLGVLIFLLLMEGIHPFNGVWRGSGEPPPVEERIRLGCSPYSGSPRVAPVPAAPPFEMLPADLRSLAGRCFGRGIRDPEARPSPHEWRECLAEAEQRLTPCHVNPQHLYSNHLSACPWCERCERLHGFDPFPPNIKQVPLGATVFASGPSRQKPGGLAAWKAVPAELYRMWREPAQAKGLTPGFQLRLLATLGVLFGSLGALWPRAAGVPMAVVGIAVLSGCVGRIGASWGYLPGALAGIGPAVFALMVEWRWYGHIGALNGAWFGVCASALVIGVLPRYRRRLLPRRAWVWVVLCLLALVCGYLLYKGSPKPPPPRPLIEYLRADPAEMQRGRTAVLRWAVVNASEVVISEGVGRVEPRGERQISPESPTEYVLTASGPGGKVSKKAGINVTPSAEEMAYKEINALYGRRRYQAALDKCKSAESTDPKIRRLCDEVRKTFEIVR